jgi:transposase
MNDYISDLISLADPDSEVFDVESVGDLKKVHIRLKRNEMYCPACRSRMKSKGWRCREVNHPVLQGGSHLVLVLHQRKWHCPNCGEYIYDQFCFVEKYKQNTMLVPYMIIDAMRDLNVTGRQAAERFHVSDTYVHNTFLSYVSMPRLPLSDVISVDEVYLDFNADNLYALIILDFRTGEPIDILQNRKQETTEMYFRYLPEEERNGVKILVCDMYEPYINFVTKYFPNAICVVDSFHVIQKLIQSLRYYVNGVKRRYQERDNAALEEKNYQTNRDNQTIKESNEVFILKHFYWALLKDKDDIEYSLTPYYSRKLRMSLDTFQRENMFLDLDPAFRPMRDLKEIYIRFNRDHQDNPKDAAEELDQIIDIYKAADYLIFRDFARLLSRYHDEIINSFIYVPVKLHDQKDSILRRVSNGPMESWNNIPKDYKRSSNGVSDFEYTRNRILWATRTDAHPRAVPIKQIKYVSTKKRGPYKKKSRN